MSKRSVDVRDQLAISIRAADSTNFVAEVSFSVCAQVEGHVSLTAHQLIKERSLLCCHVCGEDSKELRGALNLRLSM